jgi:hypothetical protein
MLTDKQPAALGDIAETEVARLQYASQHTGEN